MILLIIVLFGFLNENADCVNLNFENLKCHDHFCDSVICDKITDCPNGRIVPKSSFCKCCDACIPTIGRGQRCEISIKGSLRDIRTAMCEDGLKCINGICILDSPRCLKRREFLQKHRSEGLYADNLWIPECDEKGNYKAKQTKNNRKSFCVDTEGNRIFGTEEEGSSQNMTCGCSRAMAERKKNDDYMVKPDIHCTPWGNFDRAQCIGDLCFCSDPISGRIEGRIVKMKHLDKLPCKPSTENYLKPCEKEIQRTRKIVSDFHLKGVNLYLEDSVNCDPDGTFSPVQCDQTVCVCTNINGIGIKSYFMGIEDYHNLTTKMTCDCARDVDTQGKFPALNCKYSGNFIPLHCFRESACFCVDEDGDFISKELEKSTSSESLCTAALQQLREHRETKFIITTTPTVKVTDDDYSYVD